MTTVTTPPFDLRTAQNRMHAFVSEAVARWRTTGLIDKLAADRERRLALARETEERLFRLLNIPADRSAAFHMGLADSGKRAIEIFVNSLFTGTTSENAALFTENYVGHNKWSAAQAMDTLKGVPLSSPFGLQAGQALTSGADEALQRARDLIRDEVKTFYIAWNSTSTGVEERVDELVAFRNAAGSRTLILADASSYSLLSRRWRRIDTGNLPDAFFFSFRKQPALPYEGKQDEIEQMKNSGAVVVFNDRALERAREVAAEPIYGFDFRRIVSEYVPEGEKHIVHMLKLNRLLEHCLDDGGSVLDRMDGVQGEVRDAILDAFEPDGRLGRLGYSLLAAPWAQSLTSYVFRVPPRIGSANLLKRLEAEQGIVISPALHPQANTKSHNILRFGVYSATRADDVRRLLDGIAEVSDGA